MLTVVDVNLDKSEMLLTVDNGKGVSTQKIAYDKISKLRFTHDTERSWFVKKTVKKIEIFVRGKDESIVIKDSKLKSSFTDVEAYLRQIAVKNSITVEG